MPPVALLARLEMKQESDDDEGARNRFVPRRWPGDEHPVRGRDREQQAGQGRFALGQEPPKEQRRGKHREHVPSDRMDVIK
jgi:hypothetical protein